jgi:uncharacterized tellurite resistance protein B-like protein
MLEKIKHFFDKHIALTESQDITEEKLKVASAALFMEMMHTENTCQDKKRHLILGLLETAFSLSENQASMLIEIAEYQREQATDYFEFTHLICDTFSHTQKIQMIESLWKIALLDDRLVVEEEYLVDKIARLLFIPHAEVLDARNRVREM